MCVDIFLILSGNVPAIAALKWSAIQQAAEKEKMIYCTYRREVGAMFYQQISREEKGSDYLDVNRRYCGIREVNKVKKIFIKS